MPLHLVAGGEDVEPAEHVCLDEVSDQPLHGGGGGDRQREIQRQGLIEPVAQADAEVEVEVEVELIVDSFPVRDAPQVADLSIKLGPGGCGELGVPLFGDVASVVHEKL